MEPKRMDIRLSSIVQGVRELEEPQAVYTALARERANRTDGIVNLFTMKDIIAVNRHPAVLGQGGGAAASGQARPLIPLDIDGPEHAQWRRLLDPLFGPKKVAELEDAVRERASSLIDEFVADGEVEAYSRLCQPLPAAIFLNLLGAPLDDLPFFMRFKDGIVRPEGETDAELHANAQKAAATMYGYLGSLIAQHRAVPKQDLISALLEAEVGGEPLPDDRVMDILFLLMMAGLDTVAASLSCIISWLARHPEQRARLVNDPSGWRVAIEEIMRVESPVPAGTRYATVDLDLGDGLVVKAGEEMHAMWAAANVDPAVFDDPLTVDLDRPRNAHIAFASGVHRCLGSHFARLQIRVVLEEFHKRIPDYRIATGQQVHYNNVAVRMAHHLPLQFGTG